MKTPITPAQRERLIGFARREDARWAASWNARSGTDRAEGELYKLTHDFYRSVADGGDVEDAITVGDTAWRAYAERGNRKVAEAPKIRRGPSAGNSTIHHRWVSPDLFQHKALHLRGMVGFVFSQPEEKAS